MSEINCYLSDIGNKWHDSNLKTLIKSFKHHFVFKQRSYETFLDDKAKEHIKKADCFIIFGTKLYFSSLITIEELKTAIENQKSILFLKGPELKYLVDNEGFADETADIKKAKNLIEMLKNCETYDLTKETVSSGYWNENIINGIENSILNCSKKHRMNHGQQRNERKITFYVSYADCNQQNIIALRTLFDSNFKFESRLSKNLVFNVSFLKILRTELKDLISDSNILIAYVTEDYFHSDVSTCEFNHALDINKQILCLLCPKLKEIGQMKPEKHDKRLNSIQRYLQTMKPLHTYELPFDTMHEKEWKEISTPLNERLKEIIEKDLILENNAMFKKFSLNVPSSHNLSTEYKNHYKEKYNPLNFLLRGTACDNKKIAIISKDKEIQEKYFIEFYDISTKDQIHLSERIDCSHPNLLLSKPSLITINNRNQIIIFDESSGCLALFDKNLNYISRIDAKLNGYNDMTVDEDTNDIYLVKFVGKSDIKVIDYETKKGKPLNWLNSMPLNDETFKPRFIRVANNQIFIVNLSSPKIDQNSRELIETTFGESYIYILDKNPFNLKHLIDLKKYTLYQPWNLIVDKNSNIYTTVSQMNDKKYISNERFLCKFNKNGDPLDSMPLKHTYLSNDIIFLDDKLLFFNENNMILYA